MEGVRFKTDWTNDAMADLHLKNMREQLLQLKTAFKLAMALNRTIIMPKARAGRWLGASTGKLCSLGYCMHSCHRVQCCQHPPAGAMLPRCIVLLALQAILLFYG